MKILTILERYPDLFKDSLLQAAQYFPDIQLGWRQELPGKDDESSIRHKNFRPPLSCVTLRPPHLDSEMGWTEELSSDL